MPKPAMPKILVVDDDPIIRKLMAMVLRRGGHEVVEAENGAKALQSTREALPDLIILDLYMPEMDGAAFVRALRDDEQLPQVRVALHTARHRPSHSKTVRTAADARDRSHRAERLMPVSHWLRLFHVK